MLTVHPIDGVSPAAPVVVRTRRRRWLGVLAVVVAALLVAGGTHYRATPKPFRGGYGSTLIAPGKVGSIESFGMVGSIHDPTVRVTATRPVVVAGSVPAAITALACPASEGVLGGQHGPPPTSCVDAVGARLGVDDAGGGIYLLVVVVPTRPGRVVIDGVEVSFRYGWRTGRQRYGIQVILNATD